MIELETTQQDEANRDQPPVCSQHPGGLDSESHEKFPSVWQGLTGTLIMLCGVILPALAITVTSVVQVEAIWHLMLRHPISTLLQSIFLCAVPTSNYLTWRALVRKDGRNPAQAGIFNGFGTGIAGIVFGITTAAVYLNFPTIDADGNAHPFTFTVLSIVSLFSMSSGLVLWEFLRRSKGTRRARSLSIVYSLIGVMLALAGVALSEAKSAYVRYLEVQASSDNSSLRDAGLKALRSMDCELAMRLECADARTAGLAGLFSHIDPNNMKQIYFAATGKPFHDDRSNNLAAMTDAYLKVHVVGTPIEGLSLVRSAITGDANSDSLSSTVNWTFVFRNKSFSPQEARAELALPPGAVVSGLTLWMDGKPHEAAFGVTDQVKGAYRWVTVNHRDPALVTDLGHGRILLQCYPVPVEGELKARITITTPMSLDSANEAALSLPHLLDQNFAVKSDPEMRLRSNGTLSLGLQGMRRVHNSVGTEQLVGTLKSSDSSASACSIRTPRTASFAPIACLDKHTKSEAYIIENISKTAANIPNHVVVVVDASQSIKSRLNDIESALNSLPKNVDASLIIAKGEENVEPMPLKDGLDALKKMDLPGGEDNLPAMIKAAEEAGEEKGGAVLWIHGPQPSLNGEMYIMAPYTETPVFYELALDNGATDANEFFKNHREIGPFTAIPRNGNVSHDLEHFLSQWKPGSCDYTVRYNVASKDHLPAGARLVTGQQCAEVNAMYGKYLADGYFASGHTKMAADTASTYNLVTSITGAVVLEQPSDYKAFGLTDRNVEPAENAQQMENSGSVNVAQNSQPQDAPALQGAVNGTIGYQGADTTVIRGVNTAGTVRVNNMANLEALLNIIANSLEILGLGYGVGTLLHVAFIKIGSSRPVSSTRVAWAVSAILIGLMLPAMINWLIDSARDANLFS